MVMACIDQIRIHLASLGFLIIAAVTYVLTR